MSLDIVIISNEPIKFEIVNACNRVTNNVIILLASLDCCKRDVSKLVLLLTSEILHYEQFNIQFIFFLPSFPSRSIFLVLVFISCFVFICFVFFFPGATNDMCSVIRLYDRLLSKLVLLKNSGDLNITKSLKFLFFSVLQGFASWRFFFSYLFLFCDLLFCLHLAYFFLPVFYFLFFCFHYFFSQQLLAIEKHLAILTGRQQILKKAYNATE